MAITSNGIVADAETASLRRKRSVGSAAAPRSAPAAWGSAVYPASRIACTKSFGTLCWESKTTRALDSVRLTAHLVTPGTSSAACSTDRTQLAQVMPSIESLISFSSGCGAGTG